MGFKPTTELASYFWGITFLAGICISLIDLFVPIGSQYLAIQLLIVLPYRDLHHYYLPIG